MSTKHTPAPWFHRETMTHMVDGGGKSFTISPVSKRQMSIAHIDTKDIDEPILSKYRYDIDEAEANARLISLSPELLEAGEQLLYQLSVDGHVQRAAQDLADIIAKAKGES